MRRRSRLSLLGYLLLVHAALLAFLLDPRVGDAARDRLGIHPDNAHRFYYRHAQVVHGRLLGQRPEGAVLWLGDSILEGLHTAAVDPASINLAIGGDTSEGLLARLPADSILSGARAVVLAIGINDLLTRHRAPESVAETMRRIRDRIPASIPLVWGAVLPAARREVDNRAVARLDRLAERLCSERPGCVWVDPRPALTDASGALRDEMHGADGVHPTSAGYRALASAYRAGLARALH